MVSGKMKYPIYVISKGRWSNKLTVNSLLEIGIDFRIVIEPQEYNNYAAVIDPAKILVLPFSNLGQGSIPARNWVWEHSISIGAERHWILDDNIRNFYIMPDRKRRKIISDKPFVDIELFVDRYINIALAGMNYSMFGVTELSRNGLLPIRFNTRIYSCILIKNDLSYRWRGRYNEDTDLSLRVLKDGWCTVLFNYYLCGKQRTMTMPGGNTESLYKLDNDDGRLLMAQSLQRQHPDVVKITRKWGRWQHQVDYRPFKGNKLIRKPGIEIPEGVNNYGMKLVKLDER